MKKFFRIIAIILIVTMFTNEVAYAVSDVSSQENNETRRMQIFEDHLKYMVNTSKNINGVCSRTDVEYQIDAIWEVEDLLGNRYTLVECDPYGYMIYHNESGNFVEYSPGTLSPYSFDNHCDKMIYAGPNSYYYQKENGIVYSVFGSESLNDNELLE